MALHPFRQPLGRLVHLTIDSVALRGNLLGDPTCRTVAVYLPPGYDAGSRRYPLFVDLVGYTGSGLHHTGWRAFDESVPQQVDRLVEQGVMGPVVVAFPDCFTSLGGNQYIDSAALGNWATYLTQEMVPALEAEFRLIGGRDGRAVFGKSSGGYGALIHGMLYPQHWGAVACHSGDMAFELCYRKDFPHVLTTLAQRGGTAETFIDGLRAGRGVSGSDFHVLMTLAMAATYDPDPGAPYGVRLPVDPETAELDEEAWSRWQAWDPVHLVDRPAVQEALRSLHALYIDCGDRDQYDLHFGARRLVRKLKSHAIDHVYEEFPDNHSRIDYRMDHSLPILYSGLAGAQATG